LERLPPDQAAELAAKAVQPILDAMAKPTDLDAAKRADPNTLSVLAGALGKLSERLAPEHVAKVMPEVLDAMVKTNSPSDLNSMAQAMGKLTERLSPVQVAEITAKATEVLLDTTFRTTDRYALNALAQAVGKLAERSSLPGVVELLKHPFCVGVTRHAVLKGLARRLGPADPQGTAGVAGTLALLSHPLAAAALAAHGEALYPGGRREFTDLWEAVASLRQLHPELDLAAPARRLSVSFPRPGGP
jgi:hypothetical protein